MTVLRLVHKTVFISLRVVIWLLGFLVLLVILAVLGIRLIGKGFNRWQENRAPGSTQSVSLVVPDESPCCGAPILLSRSGGYLCTTCYRPVSALS